jgi:hypothetical protein
MKRIKLITTLQGVVLSFKLCFTQPSFESFQSLLAGALLNRGRQTVANMVRSAGPMSEKSYASYSRFFNDSAWEEKTYSFLLLETILRIFPRHGRPHVRIIVDENLLRRKGKNVYGKCLHRDAVRSSQKHLVTTYGQKWVVFTVLVAIPGTRRSWALPVELDIYQTKRYCQQHSLDYLSSADITQLFLSRLKANFPHLSLEVIADGGFASVSFVAFCSHEGIKLSGKTKVNTILYNDPPRVQHKRRGRKKIKGARKKSLKLTAQDPKTFFKEFEVRWYDGQMKKVQVLNQEGLWYKPGKGLVRIRLILVRDPQGTRQDECLYSTDLHAAEKEIIETVVLRWNIEVTFEELREYLDLESMKNWTEPSVKKQTLFVFSLYSLTAAWFSQFLEKETPAPRSESWYVKDHYTFSDALYFLRREILNEFIFSTSTLRQHAYLIPRNSAEFLVDNLARAA